MKWAARGRNLTVLPNGGFPHVEKTLRITAKGREVIQLCSKVGNYSFDSIEKLRLYEVGVLKTPTGDKYTDNYIESLLKGGFLEEVPIKGN